ncbi:Uncharacterised protein [Psychrobacter phenylpyruvicus]|uniref:Uncharacterized protein n=1 Tax=Psychrobacter phenylpyruvicus TaxID=29432 RepID=A0A379LIE6_9GAMM|nr:Uncharacterised protein [Psychrobacter phenylpyruvicus]
MNQLQSLLNLTLLLNLDNRVGHQVYRYKLDGFYVPYLLLILDMRLN